MQQNAFMEVDWFSSYDRQKRMLNLLWDYDRLCRDALARGAKTQELFDIPMREAIGRAKSVPEDTYEDNFRRIRERMQEEIELAVERGGELA